MQPCYLAHMTVCALSSTSLLLTPSQLTTWEFLTSVHTHMNLDSMVGLEDLLAHRKGSIPPGDCGHLIGYLVTSLACAPSRRSSPQRRADTCCFTRLRALFFTTPSSSAARGCAGTSSSCTAGAGGPPKLCLATPGAGSMPSALSSLVNPTVRSSSVSEGCAIFQRDTFSSEHSHTDFSRCRSALTENIACGSFRWSFTVTIEKQWNVQRSIQLNVLGLQ